MSHYDEPYASDEQDHRERMAQINHVKRVQAREHVEKMLSSIRHAPIPIDDRNYLVHKLRELDALLEVYLK